MFKCLVVDNEMKLHVWSKMQLKKCKKNLPQQLHYLSIVRGAVGGQISKSTVLVSHNIYEKLNYLCG